MWKLPDTYKRLSHKHKNRIRGTVIGLIIIFSAYSHLKSIYYIHFHRLMYEYNVMYLYITFRIEGAVHTKTSKQYLYWQEKTYNANTQRPPRPYKWAPLCHRVCMIAILRNGCNRGRTSKSTKCLPRLRYLILLILLQNIEHSRVRVSCIVCTCSFYIVHNTQNIHKSQLYNVHVQNIDGNNSTRMAVINNVIK